MPVSDLFYAEKDGNNLVYHTRSGDFRERGSIQALKTKLSDSAFAECISGCLVNLAHVERLGKDTVLERRYRFRGVQRQAYGFLRILCKADPRHGGARR